MQNLSRVVDISSARGDEFTSKQQSAAVLRTLSGRSSLRTGEAFASSIPGFAALSEAVFPVAGAIAFGTVVAEGVSHLKEMYDTAQKVPNAIAEGFAAINRPLMSDVDALQLNNDELQATIDKLEHKPGDALALAIDDARKRTDALANSARTAAEAIDKLLKENQNSALSQLFLNKGDTADISSEIKKDRRAHHRL
jgi:hypothetical protein